MTLTDVTEISTNGHNDSGPTKALGPESPIPKVASLNSKDFATKEQLLDGIIESVRTSGGCIIRNLVSRDVLSRIESEVRPHLDNAEPWNGDFWPPETRKVMGLLGKSPTFACEIIGCGLWQDICAHFLTSRLQHNWVGDKEEKSECGPQLNNTVVFSIGPGAKSQVLHRDDPIHHTQRPAVARHELGRDNGLGFFVAGKPSTKYNGATRFIPGSHLWDYSVPPPKPQDEDKYVYYAELDPGDALVVCSGCYHGGSANTTKDQERLLYSTFSTRGYLRQEENQYLANDVERVKQLPLWLQRFAGYSLSRPFMGWVEMDDPMRVIHPEMEHTGDLW